MTERDLKGLKGVVLAAGAGTRLRPLTLTMPKALAPVGGRPLVEWAIERIRPYVDEVAVNVHHHAEQMVEALTRMQIGLALHVSIEGPEALGTAGALGRLRPWLGGRPVLVTNADAWHPAQIRTVLDEFVAGWDRERPRLLCAPAEGPGDFDGLRYVGTALLPWSTVADLAPRPSGLYEVSWSGLYRQGALELVPTDVAAIDCGTPEDYERANVAAGTPGALEAAMATRRGE